MKKLHGVHVPHRKNTAGRAPERMPVPPAITLPMNMHIGAPAKPVVSVGDEVLVGSLVAEAGGFVSSPVYSGVSGKVKKIDEILTSAGKKVPAVIIETDGLQRPIDYVPPTVTDTKSFLEAVRMSGVVGLGGAGFPTAVKLSVKDLNQIEAVVINGAECEPYITSDTRTMLDQPELVLKGIELLQKHLSAKRIIFAIEDNKPDCLKLYREKTKGISGVEVQSLPAMYPQGGEKVLIYHTTGRMVPEGGLPIDAGAVVINCTTLAALARYITTGVPLFEKCVTVDGSAVREPKNVIVPIGTPMQAVFDFCGGFKEEPKKVLYGGPMMGIAVPDTAQPVLKTTNALLAFAEKDAVLPETTACIRCGTCIRTCPLNLMPVEIEHAYNMQDGARLKKLKVNLCMECGCCAYVCPAHRSLVQVNKLAKATLAGYNAEQKAEAERAAARAAAKSEAKEAEKK